MAITKSKTTRAAGTNTRNGEVEKAAGFLNVALPTRDGKALRLFALPLTIEGDDTHRQIFEYLTVDSKGKPLSDDVKAERLQTLKNRLVIDLGMRRSDEERALDLE